MTIGKRLLLLLAVPLIALLGFGVFARVQLAKIEERSRFVAESQLASVAVLGNISRSFAEIRVNLRSIFLCSRAVLPGMIDRKWGRIISISSQLAHKGAADMAHYAAAKAGVIGFTRSLAYEVARHGITVNAICPGPVDTAWTHEETGPMDHEMEKSIIAATPMARRGTPEEIANVYAFLASDEASFVTGALWVVDGGITVGKGAIGEQTPEVIRKAPEGRLRGLRHSRDGLRGKPFRKGA